MSFSATFATIVYQLSSLLGVLFHVIHIYKMTANSEALDIYRLLFSLQRYLLLPHLVQLSTHQLGGEVRSEQAWLGCCSIFPELLSCPVKAALSCEPLNVENNVKTKRSTPPLLGNLVKNGSYEHTHDCEHLLEWVGTMAIHRRLLNNKCTPRFWIPLSVNNVGIHFLYRTDSKRILF